MSPLLGPHSPIQVLILDCACPYWYRRQTWAYLCLCNVFDLLSAYFVAKFISCVHCLDDSARSTQLEPVAMEPAVHIRSFVSPVVGNYSSRKHGVPPGEDLSEGGIGLDGEASHGCCPTLHSSGSGAPSRTSATRSGFRCNKCAIGAACGVLVDPLDPLHSLIVAGPSPRDRIASYFICFHGLYHTGFHAHSNFLAAFRRPLATLTRGCRASPPRTLLVLFALCN